MKSNFIETKKAVDDITYAIDKQIKSATELNNIVVGLNGNYSKLPSEYLRNQKQIAETNLKIVKSEQEVVKVLNQKTAKTSEEIVNQRILRTNADRLATANSKLAGAYRNLSSQVAIASEKVQNLIARGKLATQTQSQFNRELRQAQNEFRTLQNRVLQADKAVDKWSRTNERSIALGRDLLGAFGVVGGVTAFAMISRDIFQQTKEIQSLNKALELVTTTQENFYAQQVFLQRISESYGIELNGLTKQFTQFYVSAKDKLSGTQIQTIFESITKAGASMGLSVESQQRAFLALNQMMSKGTIQAEELRGQLGEALPGAFGIMAKAVGVTEKELAKMMKDGDLLASVVLPKFAKQLEITYGIENVNRIDNIVSAQNRLTNSWRNFIASLDKDGNKFSMFLTKSLNLLADVVKGMEIAFESSEQTKKRISETIFQNSYNQQMAYLKSLKEGQDEAINGTKSFNRRWIIENNKVINDLLIKNKGLKKQFTDFFANKSELKEQYDANILKIEELRGVNSRYYGQIKASNQFELDSKAKIVGATEKQTKLTKEQIAEQKKLNDELERELKLRNDLLIARANRELIGIKNELENEKLYINDRLDLLDKQAQKETEIALLKYQENIRLHKDSNTQMEIDAIEFQNKIDEINKERVDNGLKELNRYYKEFEDYQAKFEGEGLKLEIFGENPADGFEKWKQGSEKAKKGIDDLKQATKDWLQSFEDSFIGDSGFTTLFDILNKKIEGFGDNFATTFIGITEVVQEAMNFIGQASSIRFENEQANLEKEKDFALSQAGDVASAREEIERQYAIRQKEIRVREFKTNQALAIANIGINTAQAIMATYARLGFPLGILPSAIMGGIGLAQIALVASQQVPQFWKGTDNAPEGWALTQERGREIITDKSGKIKSYGSDKGAQMTYLNKGYKVFNNDKTMDYLMFNDDLNNILVSNNIDKAPTINVNNSGTDLTPVVNAINNKESLIVNFDENGLNKFYKNGSTTTQNMNKKVRFVGKSV